MTRIRHSVSVMVGALVVSVGIASRAAAKVAPKVALRYAVQGVPDCLSERAFRDAVMQRFDDDPLADDGPITVVTDIARDGPRIRATVKLHDPTTESDATQEIFAGPGECRPLSAAAALAVSLTIERSRSAYQEATPAVGSSPAPPSGASSSTSSVASSAKAASSSPLSNGAGEAIARARRAKPSDASRPGTGGARAQSTRPLIEVRTHAAVMGGFGILPTSSVGESFGASLKAGRWSSALEAGAWLPAAITSASGSDGAKAWLVFLSGAACVHEGHLFMCGIGSVGNFRAVGSGLSLSRGAATTYVSFGGRLGIEVPLARPFSLVVQGTLVAPLVRPAIRIGDDIPWRMPVVAGDLGFGLRMSIL